jgi:hypothetical protein
MKKNVGNIDKAIRILIALVVIALYFTNIITGTLGIILLIVAAILILTSIVSFCPIWMILGLSTGNKEEKK